MFDSSIVFTQYLLLQSKPGFRETWPSRLSERNESSLWLQADGAADRRRHQLLFASRDRVFAAPGNLPYRSIER